MWNIVRKKFLENRFLYVLNFQKRRVSERNKIIWILLEQKWSIDLRKRRKIERKLLFQYEKTYIV